MAPFCCAIIIISLVRVRYRYGLNSSFFLHGSLLFEHVFFILYLVCSAYDVTICVAFEITTTQKLREPNALPRITNSNRPILQICRLHFFFKCYTFKANGIQRLKNNLFFCLPIGALNKTWSDSVKNFCKISISKHYPFAENSRTGIKKFDCQPHLLRVACIQNRFFFWSVCIFRAHNK